MRVHAKLSRVQVSRKRRRLAFANHKSVCRPKVSRTDVFCFDSLPSGLCFQCINHWFSVQLGTSGFISIIFTKFLSTLSITSILL